MVTFEEFVRAMQGPWINGAVGLILSFVGEFLWEGYQALPSKKKRLVFIGLSLVLPLFFAAIGTAMGYQGCGSFKLCWELTFWPALVQGALVAFGTGTAVHTLWLNRGKNNAG